MRTKETKIITCKTCNVIEEVPMYYNPDNEKVPLYKELFKKGWHRFGIKWICSKCYDENIKIK